MQQAISLIAALAPQCASNQQHFAGACWPLRLAGALQLHG